MKNVTQRTVLKLRSINHKTEGGTKCFWRFFSGLKNVFSTAADARIYGEQSYWKSAEWRGLKLLINAKWWRSRVIARKPPLFNSRKYKINTRYIHTKRTKTFYLMPFDLSRVIACKPLLFNSREYKVNTRYNTSFGMR